MESAFLGIGNHPDTEVKDRKERGQMTGKKEGSAFH